MKEAKINGANKPFSGVKAGSFRAKVAEREGFEPSIRFCRILTFQASAFDHSATAPHIYRMPGMGAV